MLLLVHGLDDDTVWPSNTRSLARSVRSAGGRVETRLHPGLGHVGLLAALSDPFDWLAPVRHEVIGFVTRGDAHPGDKPAHP